MKNYFAHETAIIDEGCTIKDGAKMVMAMSNSTVPKFTIIMGNSYGAGNYAMCGKAYDPRLIVAWPSAKIGVMGGDQAAKTLLQIETSRSKGKGEEITEEAENELLNRIKNRYENGTKPEFAASRLWVDAIINPLDTRKWISMGIEAAEHACARRRGLMGAASAQRCDTPSQGRHTRARMPCALPA